MMSIFRQSLRPAYEGGTGKYQGIQGSHTYKCSGMGAEGQAFCRQEANYRLR